jgi:hypothetical protein
MNEKKMSALLGAACCLLLPYALCSATAPLYQVIPTEYAPTLSAKIVDDSYSDIAIVEFSLTNSSDNLLAITNVFFGASSVVGDPDDPSTEYSSPRYTSYWRGTEIVNYQRNMLLAPQSRYLLCRTTISKTGSSDSSHYQTYEAIKNGRSLTAAFSGEVFSSTIYKAHVDYTFDLPTVMTSYSAETNQTFLRFWTYNFDSKGISYDDKFFSFTYGGFSYSATDNYSSYDDGKPFVSGYHVQEDFTLTSVHLYSKKEMLFDGTKDVNPSHVKGWTFSDYVPYIIFGLLAVIVIALVIGLIILKVWLGKKKKASQTPVR